MLQYKLEKDDDDDDEIEEDGVYSSKDAIEFRKSLPEDEKRVTIAIPTDADYALDSSVFDEVEKYAKCPITEAENSKYKVRRPIKDCLAIVSSIYIHCSF